MDRFLARVVLVPFAYDPPPITPDVLDNFLQDAPAALPQALQVGNDFGWWIHSEKSEHICWRCTWKWCWWQVGNSVFSCNTLCSEGTHAEWHRTYGPITLANYTLQVVDYAQHTAISRSNIWTHFLDVTVPASKQFQAKIEDNSSLGQLLNIMSQELVKTTGSVDEVWWYTL